MIPADIRTEVLALDTILIENFWPRLQQHFETEAAKLRQGGVLAHKNRSGLFEIHAEFQPRTEADLRAKMSEDPFKNIWILRDVVVAVGTELLLTFTAELDAEAKCREYLRLKELLAYEKLSHGLDPAFWVAAHLHKGLNSGNYACFDVLRTLPLAFARATGASPSEQEFRLLAERSQQVLLFLAALDLRAYVNLRDSSRKFFPEASHEGRKEQDYEFPMAFFGFSSEAGRLQIDPVYLQNWKEEYKPVEQLRRGCPARLSKSEPRSNVILSLYKLQLELFLKYCGPHLRTYVESGNVK